MDNSRSQQHQLGVNKMGKSIKKSPLHQPSYGNQPSSSQPQQPQVYNISKQDFRSIVQQLTGTGAANPPPQSLPRLPQPRPPSQRLQRIRPPPLTPIARPPPPPLQQTMLNHSTNTSSFVPRLGPPAESPVSAYMRYLESSLLSVREPPANGLLPTPPPRPSPRGVAALPSPLLPSPSGFWNLVSPRSPFPILSPGFGLGPPLTPNFALSPLAQPGILGPVPQMPPLSPGLFLPPSPTGFVPLMSPTWRDLL